MLTLPLLLSSLTTTTVIFSILVYHRCLFWVPYITISSLNLSSSTLV